MVRLTKGESQTVSASHHDRMPLKHVPKIGWKIPLFVAQRRICTDSVPTRSLLAGPGPPLALAALN